MPRSEVNYKSEQVLEISESAWGGRRQVLADLIAANHLAEAVTKIQFAREPQIYPYVRSKDRTG